MAYIFGYGSLLSRPSASRTLQRQLEEAEVRPAWITGYRRTWTAPGRVYVEGAGVRDVLFLDLEPAPGAICNGMVFEVNAEELARFDLRERNYERIPVFAEGAGVEAFTYIVPAERKSRAGQVLQGYVEIVKSGLEGFPKEFQEAFWRSTEGWPEPLLAGVYSQARNSMDKLKP